MHGAPPWPERRRPSSSEFDVDLAATRSGVACARDGFDGPWGEGCLCGSLLLRGQEGAAVSPRAKPYLLSLDESGVRHEACCGAIGALIRWNETPRNAPRAAWNRSTGRSDAARTRAYEGEHVLPLGVRVEGVELGVDIVHLGSGACSVYRRRAAHRSCGWAEAGRTSWCSLAADRVHGNRASTTSSRSRAGAEDLDGVVLGLVLGTAVALSGVVLRSARSSDRSRSTFPRD